VIKSHAQAKDQGQGQTAAVETVVSANIDITVDQTQETETVITVKVQGLMRDVIEAAEDIIQGHALMIAIAEVNRGEEGSLQKGKCHLSLEIYTRAR
jgi:SepF-like predicted cell division protein (DUF552 family)